MIKAVVYARVSTDMQAEDEIPILGQLQECQKYAESRGWEIVESYRDEGFRGANTKRPAFQQMMADAREKPALFQKIITWKGNRIARHVEDRLAFQSILGRLGIDLVSLNEPEFEGATKVLMLPIMAAIDEYQSYIIAEDTLRGMKTIARQGFSAGGQPPKGYRIHREVVGVRKNGQPRFHTTWEPDPEWQGKAIKAFEMVAEGRSAQDIIRETGIVRNKSGLSYMFRNPTYIGERVYNVNRRVNGKVIKGHADDPEVIRVPNAHKAIITRELWDRVQEIMIKRRPQPGQLRSNKNDFLLSGLLWCERHDCSITGTGNNERRYYACESLRRQGRAHSDCAMMKKEALEKFILKLLKENIFTTKNISTALNAVIKATRSEDKETRDELINLNARINRTKREIENLNNAVAESGTMPASTLKSLQDRETLLAGLEQQLEELKQEKKRPLIDGITVKTKTAEAWRGELVRILDNDSPENLKIFLRYYIEQIKISGNSVSIKFAFRKPDSSQVMVAGVVLRYLATRTYDYQLPPMVMAAIRG